MLQNLFCASFWIVPHYFHIMPKFHDQADHEILDHTHFCWKTTPDAFLHGSRYACGWTTVREETNDKASYVISCSIVHRSIKLRSELHCTLLCISSCLFYWAVWPFYSRYYYYAHALWASEHVHALHDCIAAMSRINNTSGQNLAYVTKMKIKIHGKK